MDPHLHLLLHNIVCVIGAIVSLAFIFFIFRNNSRKIGNIVLSLSFLCVFIFYVSHLVGTNLPDPHLSRIVLMANVSIILLTALLCHTTLCVLGKDKERRWPIIIVYIASFAMAFFFLIFPDTFLLQSVPKLYFPNYYVPGSLHWLMRLVSNNLIPAYFFIETIVAYARSTDTAYRNRLKYLMLALILGYVSGFIPVLLIFNYPIDPLPGLLFIFFFGIPFTYGAVRYELLDIKVVAKRAFTYALGIVGAGSSIIVFNLSSQWVQSAYPDFPFWLIPLVSSFPVVGISIVVWKKLRESDVLKYEFITTATHKFRTPLTHIKWATENLSKIASSEDEKLQLQYIQSANTKLVELTGILMNASETEESAYEYRLDRVDLSDLADETIATAADQIAIKHINLVKKLDTPVYAKCDAARIRFIIQTFLENAVHYTPEGGTVTLETYLDGSNAIFVARDTGIGLSKEDAPLLFSKFFRGTQARLADTEGMGIGLFVSKEILARHHGKIWAESEGPNQGSSFYFSLPAVK